MLANRVRLGLIGCAAALGFLAMRAHPLQSAPERPVRAQVTVYSDSLIVRFDPKLVWGAALDGKSEGVIPRIYTRPNIAAMNSVGFGPISCRLRTELGIEAWHWNPAGRWSDPRRRQGYWVSSDRAAQPITRSYGYRLPRRGRTIDDANDDGYSRIDDGDSASYWKSNPYLDPRYTGEADARHPQWLAVDLGAPRAVNAIRILWGNPYPRHYRIEYWAGQASAMIDYNPDGEWRRFSAGETTAGRGGAALQRLCEAPVKTRFVRITLWESSHTAVSGSADPRDSLGFALREISIGTADDAGHLHDLVRHGSSASRQSWVLVSSTDPWHRERDRDPDVEQPGIDLIFRSGLTHELPALVAVGVLYDTPANAAALLRYLRWRGYSVPRLELGEEPDGQRVTPEDYAALYLQAADSLRVVDARIILGGPSWQSAVNDEMVVWPDRASQGRRRGWLGRFLDALENRHALDRLGFFSFEWYPFDNPCGSTAAQLARAPSMLSAAFAQ
ncbi:MAG: discoidin domain-containing protein, partial [Candidatus Eiseniibacteriota bacterium]